MEGIIGEVGDGATLSKVETELVSVTPSDCCGGRKWDRMGAITETLSDTERRGMVSPSNDLEGDISGEHSETMSTVDAGAGVDSNSQCLQDWQRDPNSDDD